MESKGCDFALTDCIIELTLGTYWEMLWEGIVCFLDSVCHIGC